MADRRPTSQRRRPQFYGAGVGSLLLIVLLAGCGDQAGSGTSPTPASVGGAASVSTSAASAPPVDVGTASGSAISPAGELTLGELTDRINDQWRDLSHFREINSSTASAPPAVASPIAASPAAPRASRSVREVALPGRARYLAEENGQLVFELIVIGEQVFARGTVASLLDPAATIGEWVVTDLATVAGNPMLGEAAARQLAALSAPAYVVPERLRPQVVRRLGDTEFEGRACALYGAADTTASGARIDLTFAVDQDDRLCFVETKSIGIASRYLVEELSESFAIRAPTGARVLASPAVGGTPAAPPSPAATP